MPHLLEIERLQTHFPTRAGTVKAVSDVSFYIDAGELVGLVGESGSGKSITALSVMRLIGAPGKIVGGSIKFKGEEMTTATEERMREIRGDDVSMIFQDPMTSLNPVYTVGEQIAEAIRLHRKTSKSEAWNQAVAAMKEVAVPDAALRAKDYPHRLSGGLRQRIMIAMALACDPELLIADEPTTALDVTIQAQILELLNELRQTRKLAILLITHDLGVVAEVADRVCVMYTGRIVEQAPVAEIFAAPKHPYTQGLLKSVPKLTEVGAAKQARLQTIEGTVPSPTDLPPGCHFAARCPFVSERCTRDPMPLFDLENGARAFCTKEIFPAAIKVILRLRAYEKF